MRAALIRLVKVDSETIRPPHTECQQIVLGDDAVAIADQVHQQVEHLRFQRDRFAAPPQFAALHVEHMIGKAKLHPSPAAVLKQQSRASQGTIKRVSKSFSRRGAQLSTGSITAEQEET